LLFLPRESTEKQHTLLLPITSLSVNWFSQFFHQQTEQQICIMRVTKDSTTPQNVLPYYLVKPMTSEIDAISRHNGKNNLSVWNSLMLHIQTDYQVNFQSQTEVHTHWRNVAALSQEDRHTPRIDLFAIFYFSGIMAQQQIIHIL